jgi:hypothetical protein
MNKIKEIMLENLLINQQQEMQNQLMNAQIQNLLGKTNTSM